MSKSALFKLSIVALLVSVLTAGLAVTSPQAKAAPAMAPRSGPTGMIDPRKCRSIEIHLLGPDKYTTTCVPKVNQGAKSSSPDSYTYQSGCKTGDLALHYNINYDDTQSNGDIAFPLCISGVGSVNDFTKIPVCYIGAGTCSSDWWWLGGTESWNDRASSFKTGSWYGDMYWNINEGGYYLQFDPNESCSNMGYLHSSFTNGPTNWNDKVSSVAIYGSYSAGGSTC